MQQSHSRPPSQEAEHILLKSREARLSAKAAVLEQDGEQDFTLGTEVSQPEWEGSQPSCGSSEYLEEFTEEMVRMPHGCKGHAAEGISCAGASTCLHLLRANMPVTGLLILLDIWFASDVCVSWHHHTKSTTPPS